jgi:transcriptional regulator with XRE-family HTH domain
LEEEYLITSLEFPEQVKSYLKYFKISYLDLAKAIKMSSNAMNEMLDGKRGIMLLTMVKIAAFFGLKYYELGNPNFPFPSEDKLPLPTKLLIGKRKVNGEPKKYGDHDLNQALDDIFKSNFLEIARTSREIADKLPDSIPTRVRTASRVSDAISKGTWEGLVVELPKVKGKKFYQLVEFAVIL